MIKANSRASKRTKERCKQHGDTMSIKWVVPHLAVLGGVEAVLIESDNWLGWLPTDEIETTEDTHND